MRWVCLMQGHAAVGSLHPIASAPFPLWAALLKGYRPDPVVFPEAAPRVAGFPLYGRSLGVRGKSRGLSPASVPRRAAQEKPPHLSHFNPEPKMGDAAVAG
jgi:hypothetical protein